VILARGHWLAVDAADPSLRSAESLPAGLWLVVAGFVAGFVTGFVPDF
jgi:hypothetical protein